MKVKICGVTRLEDARAASGADFVGLNFWASSKRRVSREAARALAAAARPAQVVGVFVDAAVDEIVATADEVGLDVIQLHGDEDAATIAALAPRRVWKAATLVGPRDFEVEALLLDAVTPGRGGSGHTIDWDAAAVIARARRVVLAGGLTPDNVAEAVRVVAPWCVDVASGVESAPGIKDHDRLRAFIAAARGPS